MINQNVRLILGHPLNNTENDQSKHLKSKGFALKIVAQFLDSVCIYIYAPDPENDCITTTTNKHTQTHIKSKILFCTVTRVLHICVRVFDL